MGIWTNAKIRAEQSKRNVCCQQAHANGVEAERKRVVEFLEARAKECQNYVEAYPELPVERQAGARALREAAMLLPPQ